MAHPFGHVVVIDGFGVVAESLWCFECSNSGGRVGDAHVVARERKVVSVTGSFEVLTPERRFVHEVSVENPWSDILGGMPVVIKNGGRDWL